VILVSVQGQGQLAISRLSIHLCGYDRVEGDHLADQDAEARKESLLPLISKAAVANEAAVMLVQESQVADGSTILVDLNCLIRHGEVPDLLAREERSLLVDGAKQTFPGVQLENVTEQQMALEYLSRV